MTQLEQDRTEAISVLVRRGAHRDAVTMCTAGMGDELGRFCLAILGEQVEAEEAVQETLVAFHDAMPTLVDTPLLAWLYSTAMTMCERRLATRSAEDSSRATALVRDDDPALPADAAKARSDARMIRFHLSMLGGEDRQRLLLRYQAGLDYSSISEIMGGSEQEATRAVGKSLLALRMVHKTGADA